MAEGEEEVVPSLRFAIAAAVSLALAAALAGRAHASPAPLPNELVRLSGIVEEIRGPLGRKVHDMLKNYATEERIPGEVSFIDKDGKKVARVKLTQVLSEDKTTLEERVALTDSEGRPWFEERTSVVGTGLKASDPARRAFFSGLNDYTPAENERRREVRVSIGADEVYRFDSLQAAGPQGKTLRTDVYLGRSNVLTLVEFTSSDESLHSLEYQVREKSFELVATGQGFRSAIKTDGWPRARYKAIILRQAGFATGKTSYSVNDSDRVSLNDFLTDFGSDLYEPLFSKSSAPFMASLVDELLPKTEQKSDLGATGWFLDELKYLRNQVAQAKNPSQAAAMLTLISQTIDWLILAYQDGSYLISGARPKGNQH